MSPINDIYKLIKKLRVPPTAEMDTKVHDGITNALQEWEKAKSAAPEPDIRKRITKSKIAGLAAAAAIAAAILIGIHQIVDRSPGDVSEARWQRVGDDDTFDEGGEHIEDTLAFYRLDEGGRQETLSQGRDKAERESDKFGEVEDEAFGYFGRETVALGFKESSEGENELSERFGLSREMAHDRLERAGSPGPASRPIPPFLTGKPLPQFAGIDIEFSAAQAKGKAVLVCFFDRNQRPSRHMVAELAKQAAQLKEKGAVIVAVQALKISKKVLDEWLSKNNISFPVGTVKQDWQKTRNAWAIKSLPWLILTDRKHIVTAEGFGLEELDEKMTIITKHDVLAELRARDEAFESGMYAEFLAPGYREMHRRAGKIVPTPDKYGKITMADGCCAIVTKNKKVPLSTFRTAASTPEEEGKDTPKQAIEEEGHTFYGPEFRARFDIGRRYEVDENGRVTAGSASRFVYITRPDDVLWNRVRRIVVWRMGRGFAKQIYEFASVVELPDGMLKCTGRGKSVGLGEGRWELVIDPANAYLVRSAKYYEHYQEGTPLPDAPTRLITTSGTKSMNGCVIAEAGYWADPPNTNLLDQPLGPLVVSYITNEPNYALLKATKKIMFGPYEGTTCVHDNSQNQHWGRIFEAGEEYESFLIARQALVGEALKGLEAFGLELDEDKIRGNMILVCFFDMNQRPSRHTVRQLAKRAGDLKQKGVVAVLVQASEVDEEPLNEWLKSNNIPFAVGMVEDDEMKIRFTWGAKSLPWLILTDRNHVVTTEGFGIEELEEKMKATSEEKPSAVKWSGEKVLEKLREFDALYFKKGFTARGMITAPAEPEIGKPRITRKWRLTALEPRVALVFEANEADIPKPKFVHELPDRYSDYTPEGYWLVDVKMKKYMHFGADWIGSFEELNHYAVDRQDKIVNVNVGFIHFASFCEPADEGFGPFWDKSELLWSLGRGYSEIIHEITGVAQLADGRLIVSALGLLKTGGKRRDQWELTIDPKAAWMVRHARCNWDPDGSEVEYEAKNSGLIWNGPLAMPERITWQRRGWRGPYIQQISCKALEAKADKSLLSKARAVILPPYPANTEVEKYTRDDIEDDYDAEELLKLVGRPLPPFESIGIGFDTAEAKGEDILLCFFDMNQRPSRHMVAELAKQAPQLKEKGVVVLCVQASTVDKEKLDEWVTDSNIPFAVRIAEDDESKIRFTWCVKSLLPWLILTDKKHIVTAEGFGLEELDEKIKESEDNYGKD